MEWKDIPGYEGLYQVSNQGDVRSMDREYMAYHWKSKELRLVRKTGKVLTKINDGRVYHKVNLGLNNQRKVHIIVALAFIPNPEGKPTVDHINRDSQDNRVSNLRWATYSEQNLNQHHALGVSGQRHIQYNKTTNHYSVRVKRNKITKCVGCFKTLPEAIEARNDYLLTI